MTSGFIDFLINFYLHFICVSFSNKDVCPLNNYYIPLHDSLAKQCYRLDHIQCWGNMKKRFLWAGGVAIFQVLLAALGKVGQELLPACRMRALCCKPETAVRAVICHAQVWCGVISHFISLEICSNAHTKVKEGGSKQELHSRMSDEIVLGNWRV